jgi:hypothetical protein
MDRVRKTLSSAWLTYVFVVLSAVTILASISGKPISPTASRLADLSASRPGTISELSKSKEWMSHVRFFTKSYLSPESSEWRNPPAAQPVGTAATQQPINDRFVSLRVIGPEEPLPEYCNVQVRFGTASRILGNPADAVVGPMLRNNTKIFLQMSKQKGFGSEICESQEVTVASNSLHQDQDVTLDLPLLPASRNELSREHVRIHVQLMRLDPDLVSEEVHETAAKSSDISSKAVSGDVSFNDLRLANNLVITPTGRYTTLIITGDHDLRPHIRCVRTDNGTEVGAYSESPPMMAVAASSWASLKVHIQVQDFGQALHYRIVSLSGDDVTTKALLLWFVAHDLTNKETEGRFLSLPEIDQRSRWLKGALDVQITDQDVAAASDLDVKQLLGHLMAIQQEAHP